MNVEKHLSVVGDICPIPLIKITQALNGLKPGQTISITGDDPIFESSVRDYCEANELEVLEVQQLANNQVEVLIRK